MMKLHEFDALEKSDIKELIKERGTKAVCKERVKASKSVPQCADNISFKVSGGKGEGGIKAAVIDPKVNALDVEVVANMAMFMDSHRDVLTANSWFKSVSERGKGDVIPFLRDHKHNTSGIIGLTRQFTTKQINLEAFGYSGKGDGLVHEATVLREYDRDIFYKYLNGSIKAHSIGLRYNALSLAFDDSSEEYAEEKALYDRVLPSIINKESVEEAGYFWYVTDIMLVENSAVLFPSNSLTPTLSVQPSNDTGEKSNTKTKGLFYSLTH